LNRNPDAKRGWANLTPSRQKEILRDFTDLKTPAAQERNVRRALHVLAGGKARFMGRDWNRDWRIQRPMRLALTLRRDRDR
jgi:hypothetical protein